MFFCFSVHRVKTVTFIPLSASIFVWLIAINLPFQFYQNPEFDFDHDSLSAVANLSLIYWFRREHLRMST
jgi:hypothetical protein